MKDNTQFIIGEIKGTINEGFKGINTRLDKINGSMKSHEDRINLLETFRDNLQGKMTIVGAIAGLIGSAITMFFNRFINKN